MQAEVAEVPLANAQSQQVITANWKFGDEGNAANLEIPITGNISDAVGEMKAQTMSQFNVYLQSHNVNTEEEVDLLEEVIDEDDAGKGKGMKRKKRKP